MSAALPSTGAGGTSGGLWLKVDAVNFVGGIVRIKLNPVAFTITYYNNDTSGYTPDAYVDLPTAQAKFDEIEKLLALAFTLVDVS